MHLEAICFASEWASNGHTKNVQRLNCLRVAERSSSQPRNAFFQGIQQKKRGEKQGWKWRESHTGATAFSAKMADKAIWGPKRASIIR